jgi:hypothetical protein
LKSIFNCIKNLFQKKSRNTIEPLLHSNAERLFQEWSSGFGISVLNSNRPFQLADIVGNYAVKGRTPNTTGEGYFGTLRLEPQGSLVKAYWEIGHTRQPQHGMGFLKDDLLALDFYYSEEGTRFYGQVIYRIDGNHLVGFWRENQVGDIAIEEAMLKNRLV